MYIWLILALLFAALEVVAVSKNLQRLEYVAKPAVMVCLFLWLYSSTGLQGNALWFGVGILFSLAGDVLLMLSLGQSVPVRADRFPFCTYLLHYRVQGRNWQIINAWSLILLVIIAINASRLIRRIIGAMRAKGQN